MWRFGLPEKEDRKKQESNDQWHIDVDLIPALVLRVGQSERHQETTECRDDQDDANDIELPEQCDEQPEWAEHLVGCAVIRQILVLLCSSVSHEQGNKQGNGQDWSFGQHCSLPQLTVRMLTWNNDSPHANAPSPANAISNSSA